MTAELVCVGLATLDTVVELPGWPQPDGRVVVESLVRAGGGPAATAAVAASRLGRSVSFVGRVGNDAQGSAVRGELADHRVDVRHLAEDDEPTAESVILVDRSAGTRAILHRAGGDLSALSPAARQACAAAVWVHVDHAGWAAAGDVAHSQLSVDAGNAIPQLSLAGLGLYGPSEASLRERYPGLSVSDAVGRALAEGAQRVVVTLGSEGALAADAGGAWRVPGIPIEGSSTLGAGDVFHGAILAALIEGQALAEALRWANAAAALSCRALGPRGAIPFRDELQAALAGSPPAQPVAITAWV
jgi:sugar/nucleoside kinase (ribokinase family)